MATERSASAQLDARQRRPDFIVHVEVDENTSAHLYAYRDVIGDQRPLGPGLGLGLMLNASIHHNDRFDAPFLVPSTTVHEDNDATGFKIFLTSCAFNPSSFCV